MAYKQRLAVSIFHSAETSVCQKHSLQYIPRVSTVLHDFTPSKQGVNVDPGLVTSTVGVRSEFCHRIEALKYHPGVLLQLLVHKLPTTFSSLSYETSVFTLIARLTSIFQSLINCHCVVMQLQAETIFKTTHIKEMVQLPSDGQVTAKKRLVSGNNMR